MSVQNFLEDEEYENENTGSSVPDFLQDEDYEESSGDEYYGGGFTDGGADSSFEEGFGGGFEDDEEELFDGSDPFEGDDEVGLGDDGESSSYGITGVSFRPSVEGSGSALSANPRDTALSGSSTDSDTTVDSGADTSRSGVDPLENEASKSDASGSTVPSTSGASSGMVPNFLEEDDEEIPSTTLSSAPSASSRESTTVVTEGAHGFEGEGSAASGTLASSSEVERPRQRRDLSKRAGSNSAPSSGAEVRAAGGGAIPSAPTGSATPTPSSGATTSGHADGSTVGESSTPSPRSSPSTVVPVLDPRAAAEPVSEREAEALKSPSSYAKNRELKFTALKQKETTLRKVGTDGLTTAERGRAARSASKPVLRTPANGKLSENELLFYANLGAHRSGDYGSSSKKELFLPPLLSENSEQKSAREARINRALAGGSLTRGAKTRLTEKDYRVLRFIAIFKFASERQIGKLLQVAEHSAYKRLNGLRKHGLTKGFKTLGVRGSVWVLTETGMDLSGYDLPRGTESALTLSMVSHQFTVNHVAAHLWSGGANVLREKSFPQRNRPDGSGGFDFGERLISELEIQSSFGKVRGTSKADAYVPQITKHMANQFDSWERAGGVGFGPSPELQQGNEYMWALYPPISNRLNYHVPDLVVARPRGADGKPQSIAVEVELKTKADDLSYERTLDAYRVDDSIYRKVVWICRLKGTAEKLTRIAKRNGLADQGRITIVPIYLEDGSRFTGKDTWSL